MYKNNYPWDQYLVGLIWIPISVFGLTCDESSTLSLGNQTTREAASSLSIIGSQNDQDCLEEFLNGLAGRFWIDVQLADAPAYWSWIDSNSQDLILGSQGCFYEFFTDRDLPNKSELDENNVTVENCIKSCDNMGYTFAGVHNGDACYCGNSFGKYGPNTGGCPSVPCSGNPNENCGSPGKNAIYRSNGGAWGVWVDGQPNNYNNLQYCGGIRKDGGACFILDENCADPLAYACEKPGTGDPCPKETGFDEPQKINTMCYYLTANKTEWYLAQQSCNAIGGQLLTVKNEVIYNSILSWLVASLDQDTIWVGLQRNRWIYSNGEEITYSNFASGQQPSTTNPANKYVAVELQGEDYVWKSYEETYEAVQVIETNGGGIPATQASKSATISDTLIAVIVVICVLVVVGIILAVVFLVYGKSKNEKVGPILDVRSEASKPNAGMLSSFTSLRTNGSFPRWSIIGSGSTTNLMNSSQQSNTSILSSGSSTRHHWTTTYSLRTSNKVGVETDP